MTLLELQNGSDIRGVASTGVVGEEINLDFEEAARISYAFADGLQARLGRSCRIAIGRDSRITGEKLLRASAQGILDAGQQAMDFGLASTPAMFMSLVDEDMALDGAIMITASHLPFNRNGMKFFDKRGGADKALIKEILLKADRIIKSFEEDQHLQIEKFDYMSRYADGLRRFMVEETGMEKPLQGARIIVDAGNGSGGFFVEKFLAPLGADTEGSLFLEPDGMFPNHVPNPEDSVATAFIKKQVLSVGADLGIIFDTDVDRAALVDSSGSVINRNKLIALISAVVLNENPNSYIVTDSVTSKGLKLFIESNGGRHHRYKRGYKNVIDEAIRLNETGDESYLAIETSGHGALKENFFLDDGAYLMVKLLAEFSKMKKEGKDLMALIKDLQEPLEEQEIRIRIDDADFKAYGLYIMEQLEAYVNSREGWCIESPNYEGIRVNCGLNDGNGWFLVRLSLHDPVLPLNIESDSVGGVAYIKQALFEFFKDFDILKFNLSV